VKKIAGVVVGLLAALVVLALLLDAWVGASPPQLSPGMGEGVLHTFDAEGARHDTRLAVVDDLFTQRAGGPARFYTIRTFLLFADIKPVRLDPR
jgi:hypothetical protein